MTPTDREELIAGYLRYLDAVTDKIERERATDQHDTSNPFYEEWEWMSQVLNSDPEEAWGIILEVIDRAEPRMLSMAGIDLLESFFQDHVLQFRDRIEKQLRSNAGFLEAFRSVYMGGVPAPIWQHFNEVLVEQGIPRAELNEWSWVDEEKYPPSN